MGPGRQICGGLIVVAAAVACLCAPAQAQKPVGLAKPLNLAPGIEDPRCGTAMVSPARSSPALRVAGSEAFCLVNGERRRLGLRPLIFNGRLAIAARRHALDMVDRGYFSHWSYRGLNVGGRVRRVGGYGTRKAFVGEALGYGRGSHGAPLPMFRSWLSSPSHNRVLFSRRFRHLAIAVAPGTPVDPDEPGATYVIVVGDPH